MSQGKLKKRLTKDEVERLDGFVDMTDSFETYENGKTITCRCGQGIGIKLDKPTVKCATCGVVIVDRNFESREPPEVDDGQSTLGAWT